jgi:nucleoside-diphosphate-sugar epimerase
MRSETILITGATGLIGSAVLRRLLASGRLHRAYVLVRDPRAWNRVAASLPDHGSSAIALEGDLALPGLGVDALTRAQLARKVTGVLHLAADTSFSQSLGQARAINTTGTARLLELADALPRLRRFAHVSTAFVAGAATGRILEQDNGDAAGWINAYEQSKHEAELLVRASSREWVILRPSTIVCDSAAGGITQVNAIHRALRLYYHGLASMIPGTEASLIDVVHGEYVALAIADLALREDSAGETYHLCAGAGALPLGELLDTTYGIWASARAWRRRSVVRPALTDLPTYRLFERSVEEVGDARLRQAVASLSHFAPQLALSKQFDTTRADAALGYSAPPARTFWPRVVHELLAAGWTANTRTAA